jgi:translation initiation factor 2 alpha subunit (eIF-2alpha)
MVKWSKKVTENSNALDLEQGVFSFTEPKKIALSLKRSAEQSERRKGTPYQSAMSMLNFYINRAGKNLTDERKEILEQAKIELRKLFQKSYLAQKFLPDLK